MHHSLSPFQDLFLIDDAKMRLTLYAAPGQKIQRLTISRNHKKTFFSYPLARHLLYF